jgi:hypothetical protein
MTQFGLSRRRRALATCVLAICTSALSTPLLAATNVAPTITGSPPTAAVLGHTYSFQPKAADKNGDTLKFSVVNKPKWMWFSTSTGRLSGTPQSSQVGHTFTGIRIKVTDGLAATALPSFSITVNKYNSAPKIAGTPTTSAVVGKSYYFRPTASDANGDSLKFSVSGKPGWLKFSANKGSLWGAPWSVSAGKTFSNIVISVSDGRATTKLAPFAITVKSATNHAPTISGTPVTSARVGQPYAFKPSAYDADRDPLRFSISGKPGWASFDGMNGTLYGTPGTANIGTFSNIVISVSDGKATANLSSFTVIVSNSTTKSVTLNWAAPTENTDGSALTNLAGYKVFYGTVSRQYSNSIRLTDASSTSAVISGLTAGTWYFAIESYTTAGVSSSYSGEVKAVL